jgi:hypothetical protein
MGALVALCYHLLIVFGLWSHLRQFQTLVDVLIPSTMQEMPERYYNALSIS